MKGSENLWNEEDLLTQMEQMQDQIEQLQQDKEDLQKTISAREEHLSQQERQSSSEISKLQSALQQAQKKLREQSEQIVRQSEADLILQDSERLKEENGKLRSENEEIRRKAAREAEADKAQIREQEMELCRKQKILNGRERVVKNKEQELAAEISRQKETIRKKVDEKVQFIRRISDAELLEKQRELSKEYDQKERKIRIRMIAAIIYGVVMTALLVVQLPVPGKLKEPWSILAGWLATAWNMLKGFADRLALNSLRIPGNVPHHLLYLVFYWGIIGILPVISAVVIALTIHWKVTKGRKSHQ